MAAWAILQRVSFWPSSLLGRVVLLCVVLALCLLGFIYVLTGHYYQEVVHEMEARAAAVAGQVELLVEERPAGELDLQSLQDEMQALEPDLFIENLELLGEDVSGARPPLSIVGEAPFVYIVTHYIPRRDGSVLKLETRITNNPQTELLRAFKNEYLAALGAAFCVTLTALVYLIWKTLRPLGRLSDACARISAGSLAPVRAQGTSSEIRALEATFNEMVVSLGEKEVVEANLRQAQRLSAIGNLAAGVAHDVRNPLNAIKLLTGHALDQLGNGAGHEGAAKQLRTIRGEVRRLEEIVSGFLSLAREEELRREPQCMDRILEECIRLVRKDAEGRGIQLSTEFRAGDTAFLLDEKQWKRALLNVIINALEASPENGRVRIYSRVTDRACEIEVRDDGPGIPRDVLERVFEPYYTTKPTGTGLGLSITRGIVEEHGGTIEIAGTAGQGCQVLITLPLSQRVEAPLETAIS